MLFIASMLCAITLLLFAQLYRLNRESHTTTQFSSAGLTGSAQGKKVNSSWDDLEITIDRFPSTDRYERRLEGLKHVQMFIGAQMSGTTQDIQLKHLQTIDWLRDATAFYALGASEMIASQNGSEPQLVRDLSEFALKASLGMGERDASEFIQQSKYRRAGSDHDEMYQAGSEAAKYWMTGHSLPKKLGLRSRLDEFGIIA